ncbi:unnamed protein product [marine sediment metagenome]|jgi:ribosomal protein S18 acetylase RimI-like enzyme|uniref:N-acetyltransferase domain-containing protein n=1 Tax=marine sediment metagenome TaxID=412755 RepID=X1PSR4_9ZZZZ
MKNLNFTIRDIKEKDTNIQFDTGFKPFGIVKGYDYLERKKQGWKVRVAVLKVDKTEKIVGISKFKIENRGVLLGRLGVDKNYQNKGIGTELVLEILRFVEKERLEYIKLLAHRDSIEFYSDLGFSIVSPFQKSKRWGYFVEMKLELF